MWRGPQGPGWLQSYVPPKNDSRFAAVLPDVGFDLLPFIDKDIATKPLVLFMLVSFLRFITDSNRARIFMRFMLVDAILLLMRGFTVATTSMPNPYPPCYNCAGECPDSVWTAIWMTITKFPFFDCGDLMFSGHTVHFLLCAMLWQKFTSNLLFKILAWAYTIPGILLLIICRMHYTNDVLIGAFLTYFVWSWYTLVIDCHNNSKKMSLNSSQSSIVENNLLGRFILWAETTDEDENLQDDFSDNEEMISHSHVLGSL